MVMYAGKIVESAGTEELFDDMHHPYTEALLASIPRLDQRTDTVLYSIPGLPPDLTNPPDFCRFQPRCRYATGRCHEEEPPLEGDPRGHQFACFNPVSKHAAHPVAVS
jgi:oligopeptide/dipeptide ABC transporter ATP-binding protein